MDRANARSMTGSAYCADRTPLRERTTGCNEIAQQSHQPPETAGKSTKERARLGRCVNSKLFTKRDVLTL
jgi:hypothetical protein